MRNFVSSFTIWFSESFFVQVPSHDGTDAKNRNVLFLLSLVLRCVSCVAEVGGL